ncbi:hypothetical protein [Kingella potus]|nr:hypothetical protein [Kingella potus]UOO99870.1 hypothetical protein LVJ84_07205 [Kingella potus]
MGFLSRRMEKVAHHAGFMPCWQVCGNRPSENGKSVFRRPFASGVCGLGK